MAVKSSTKVQRNEALRREFAERVPVPKLLKKYKISRARLYQLCKRGG